MMSRKSSRWNHTLGAAAEGHVVRHLERLGLRVLVTRYRRCGGEIDIVAEEGSTIVIVEVKARSGPGWGGGAEAVSWGKQRRIIAATRAFLSSRGLGHRPVRFDVVALRAGRGRISLDWIRDAFRP